MHNPKQTSAASPTLPEIPHYSNFQHLLIKL